MRAVRSMPPPGSHGGDAHRIAAALGVDPASLLELSATLNPVAPDPVPLLRRHLDSLRCYPDPTAATAALAEALGVSPSQVLLTNGGSEAIGLLARVVGGRCDEPAFSLYPRGDSGPLWRANPHSPFGTLSEERARPGEVWDEAFWPMVAGTWTRGDAARGALVVGSLTKLFACPGLRIGYLVVPDTERGRAVLSEAARRQPEWSVSGLATSALPELIATAALRQWAAAMAELRTELAARVEAEGFVVRPGVAPWLLVETGGGDLRSALAAEGVVVRDCASFGLPGVVRIALPGPHDLDRFTAALARAHDRLTPSPSR